MIDRGLSGRRRLSVGDIPTRCHQDFSKIPELWDKSIRGDAYGNVAVGNLLYDVPVQNELIKTFCVHAC